MGTTDENFYDAAFRHWIDGCILENEEEYDNAVCERPIAKKAWIAKGQRQESVWPYEEAVRQNGTKVVTFYSFKGGMGRTTALAGAALTLAKKGKSIVMVDTDIEAPGLATLFFEEETIDRGVLDYLLEYNLEEACSFLSYMTN